MTLSGLSCLRSKLYFQKNMDELGEAEYWRAISALKKPGADQKRGGLFGWLRRSKPSRSSSFVSSGELRDEKITVNYDTKKLKKGEYELLLTAEDLNMGTKCEKRVRIEIGGG